MADALPSTDMGSKNLPVPVPASPVLPSGLGEREVSPQAKVKDGLEPIIMSLDLLTETITEISSTVSDSDMNKITISELEKLFEEYFSKPAIADSIALALTRQSPPARDSSLLVKQQVKANEVIQKQPSGGGRFEEVFSKSSSGSGSSKSSSFGKKGMSFEEGYNKALDTAYTATHDPLKLIDNLIPGIASLFKRKESSGSGASSKPTKPSKPKGKDSFYGKDFPSSSGRGEVEEGGFFGSFGSQVERTMGGSAEGSSKSGLFGDVLPGGATSSVDDIQEEAAKVGIQADKSLYNTLENPDQSSFANFVSGADGKNKKGKEEKGAGIGTVLIVGMILAALVIFKDLVEKIFDKVIIPLGELVIDFLSLIKQPLVNLITAIIDVVVVVLGIVMDILVAIKPFLIEMATAICGIVVTVLGIVQEILIAIKPYLIQMAEAISGIVVTVLNSIKGVLQAFEPHLIAIVDALGGIAVTIVRTVQDILDLIRIPLRLISKILNTIEPYIIRVADFLGNTMAEWFEENEVLIKSLMTNISNVINRILEVIDEVLGIARNIIGVVEDVTGIIRDITSAIEGFTRGFSQHAETIGNKIGEILGTTLTAISSVLQLLLPGVLKLAAGAGDLLEEGATVVSDVLSLGAGLLSSAWNTVKKVTPLGNYLEEREARKSKEREDQLAALVANSEGETSVNDLSNLLLGNESSSDQVGILRGIHKDTTVIASILLESNRDIVDLIERKARRPNDLIISSDGQVYEPAPTDSILAIQNGQVSMQSSSPISSVSGRSSFSTDSSQGSSNSNVTNVYNSSSNVDFNGINPFSDFCPVGV